MNQEKVATSLGWPEGPVMLDDGRLAFVETYGSRISAWSPSAGYEVLADVGGGPNAVTFGSDGHLYACQNGGTVGPWRAVVQRPPSIERVSLDGDAEVVVTEIDGVTLQAPNDLSFGPDGRLYFTDPGVWDPENRPDPGYVFAVSPDGTGEVIAELGNVFPNGIVAEGDGGLVWVESYERTVKRRDAAGRVDVLATLDEGHTPDGLAVASNGDLYITSVTSGGIDIVAPGGGVKGFLAFGTVPTNCAFGDGVLFVTDGGGVADTEDDLFAGVLWKLDVGVEGQPPFRGSLRPTS